ncbi:histidine kinase/DNA gyrase B/HSP90-like ATPase [Flavobacterium sp. 103]|uniref:sensor histidine kinase n=1 Tax=Flavobacterium sp. 103 TaxID=2135624 RepID=UPI000D5DC41A|nr:ATP-binding protein [Flavobacterium sp. 103]PVX46904.1 histidine kinase/DNA gyrase B/HSP90-like ATPase [Flavobacterium sp. 103]
MEKKLEFDNLDIFLKNKQLSAVIRTLESDRKRIAQELHDDICSKLNVISLNCHLLKIPNLPAKEIEEITKNIIEYTSKALNSSKKMTHSLLPPVLDKFGLHAGIEELCAQLIDDIAIDIQYENNLKFDFKENDNHIHVFRILQELFTNSIEHGRATSISVFFEEIDGKRTCKYSDNGIGFDLNQLENHKGLGMKNVVSRVAILEGSLSIESQMNNGISVIFNF